MINLTKALQQLRRDRHDAERQVERLDKAFKVIRSGKPDAIYRMSMTEMRITGAIPLVVLLGLVCGISCTRTDSKTYQVLAYNDREKRASATVRSTEGTMLEIECEGSMIKGTDLSDPKYRTDPNKPPTWEGV